MINMHYSILIFDFGSIDLAQLIDKLCTRTKFAQSVCDSNQFNTDQRNRTIQFNWFDLIIFRYYCGCCCCVVLLTVSIFPSSVVLVTARTMSKNQVYCPQIILNWYRHFFFICHHFAFIHTLTRAARIRIRSNVLQNLDEVIIVFGSDQHLILSTCMQIHGGIHNRFVHWHIHTVVNNTIIWIYQLDGVISLDRYTKWNELKNKILNENEKRMKTKAAVWSEWTKSNCCSLSWKCQFEK